MATGQGVISRFEILSGQHAIEPYFFGVDNSCLLKGLDRISYLSKLRFRKGFHEKVADGRIARFDPSGRKIDDLLVITRIV